MSKDLKEEGEQALRKCKGPEVDSYLVCSRAAKRPGWLG